MHSLPQAASPTPPQRPTATPLRHRSARCRALIAWHHTASMHTIAAQVVRHPNWPLIAGGKDGAQ